MSSEFIETRQYQRFKEFCDACRRYQYIGLCYGMPGVGKTLSARHYANWEKVSAFVERRRHREISLSEALRCDVVFFTAAASLAGSPLRVERAIDALCASLKHLRELKLQEDEEAKLHAAHDHMVKARAAPRDPALWPHQQNAAAWQAYGDFMAVSRRYTERCREANHRPALIMVDEVDQLKMSGLEQLRAVFDQRSIGMVLIGMPGLEKRLARYPQLYSRVGFVHEFRPLSPADARQVLRNGWTPAGAALPDEALIDEEALAMIIRISEGRFRLLHRLLQQIGRVMEINQLQRVTPEVVEMARESLVIGTA